MGNTTNNITTTVWLCVFVLVSICVIVTFYNAFTLTKPMSNFKKRHVEFDSVLPNDTNDPQYIEKVKILKRWKKDAIKKGVSFNQLPKNNLYLANNPRFKKATNCYEFAMLELADKSVFKTKPQPGFRARLPQVSKSDYTCKNFLSRVEADYPKQVFNGPDSASKSCPSGTYEVSLVLDPKNKDYHWYRRGDDGTWSHKPGSTKVSNLDASGHRIVDPIASDRNFRKKNEKNNNNNENGYNYSIHCANKCIAIDYKKIGLYVNNNNNNNDAGINNK